MNKEHIIEILRGIPFSKSNLIEENLVREIDIHKDEIKIHLGISNPALHIKKKLEALISEAIYKEAPHPIDISIEFSIETKSEAPIRGNKIAGVKNIIAIASGKGGVGKSTIAANIAICLSQMGFKVGLLDADIYGPSSTILFDVEDTQVSAHWIDGKKKIAPIISHGVKLLSMGFFAGANQAVVWRGPMASKALRQLIRDAHWGELDFLMVDLPPGTGDIHLSLVQEIPLTGALIIGTPQKITLADVKKALAMFSLDAINVPVLGIIENMAYFSPPELPHNKYYIFGKEGTKNLAHQLNIPFSGQIPLIESIQSDSDKGHLSSLRKDSSIRDFFLTITQNMIVELLKRNKELPPTEAVRISTMAGCSTK